MGGIGLNTWKLSKPEEKHTKSISEKTLGTKILNKIPPNIPKIR